MKLTIEIKFLKSVIGSHLTCITEAYNVWHYLTCEMSELDMAFIIRELLLDTLVNQDGCTVL